MNFLPKIITLILVLFVAFAHKAILAANITDVSGLTPDGLTNNTTDRALNNTPIVNIATPNSHGVSLNSWSEYNVSSENQILNNHKGSSVDTILAGQIYGNPNFNKSGVNEASIIINQVTGNGLSNISGATEIAGKKANLIIANGNGIRIAGAFYINTSNLSFVSGVVNLNNIGAVDNFAINSNLNANIIINGINTPTYINLGLEASEVEFVEIISRSLQVIGDIHAKEINLNLSNKNYNLERKTSSSELLPDKPAFALDSFYLGGIYADKIIITATEDGVGVRTRGDLVANISDIVINGDSIDLANLNAKRNIIINSKNDIELHNNFNNSPSIFAESGVYLNSNEGLIKNNATIAVGKSLNKGIKNGIFINSSFFENSGTIFSDGNININTLNLFTNKLGKIEAKEEIAINSGSLVNSAIIAAEGDIKIITNKDFIDNNQIKTQSNLLIVANSGISYNDIYSGGNISITNHNSGDIKHFYRSYSFGDTDIVNLGDIVFGVDGVKDLGSLYSRGNLNIKSASRIINNINISSKNLVNINADNFVNNMHLASFLEYNSGIMLNLGHDFVNYGLVYAVNSIDINANGNIVNDAKSGAGEIFALKGDINISGKVYNNSFGNITKNDLLNISSFNVSQRIWEDLVANSYIDDKGKISDKFKDINSLELFNVASDLDYYKEEIYKTLSNSSPKIVNIKGNANSITKISKNFNGTLDNIMLSLFNGGYIDNIGNILQKFYNDTTEKGVGGLNLGDDPLINYLKDDVFLAIEKVRNGNVTENYFLGMLDFDLSNMLIKELIDRGYLDNNGNVSDLFNDKVNIDNFIISDSFSGYKINIYSQIVKAATTNKILLKDLNSINYQAVKNGNIDNAKDFYNTLIKEGVIDGKGNVNTIFYSEDIIFNTSFLKDYQVIIKDLILNVDKGKISNTSFYDIVKSPRNSAEDLLNDLVDFGYLNENYQKTQNFSFVDANDFASSFNKIGLGGRYQEAKSAIWNKLISKEDDYSFKDIDFLGVDFDKNTLFDENQILLEDLIAKNYLSNNGAIKQEFLNIFNDYGKMNIDPRFLVFKEEIGYFLAEVNNREVLVNKNSFKSLSAEFGKDKAEQIFNHLISFGYLDENGDLTKKLVDEVIDYKGLEKDNRLYLGSFQEFDHQIYQELLAKYNITKSVNYAEELSNINGASINSFSGNVNIKALSLNNIAKDNQDLNISEVVIDRKSYRNIANAWKNTVLWGYDAVYSNLDSEESVITAKENIVIIANDILNNSSIISTGGNLDIKATNLKNLRTEFNASVPYIYQTHWKKCGRFRGCKQETYYDYYWFSQPLFSNTKSIISAGLNLNILAVNDLIIDSPHIDLNFTYPLTLKKDIDPNPPTVNSNWQIIMPKNINGLFFKAAPDKEYLIETAYNINDPHHLTGSHYYKSRFGFDPNQNGIKWLGDPFYEWNLINQQIIAINKIQNQYGGTNWQDNFNQLIDNAYLEQDNLKLVVGSELTLQQIKDLKSDIIWYELKTIDTGNGVMQKVVYPRLYLAYTKDKPAIINYNAEPSSALLANNIDINANNVINYGKIIASANLFGVGGNLAINTFSNIENKSQIIAENSLNLIAKGNINNDSNVDSINIFHNKASDIFSKVTQTAVIAGGSLIIKAQKEFNSIASTVIADGDILIEAGSVNILAKEIRNRIERVWGGNKKGGSYIAETVENVASNILARGNVKIMAIDSDKIGNINVSGSNIRGYGDGYLLTNFGDINIANAVNSILTVDSYYKKIIKSSLYNLIYDYQESALESTLAFNGSLNIVANSGEFNLIGSSVKVNKNLNIGNVAMNQNSNRLSGADKEDFTSYLDLSGVNIEAAELKSWHYEINKKSKLKYSDSLKMLFNPVDFSKQIIDIYHFIVMPNFNKDVLKIKKGPKYLESSNNSDIKNTRQYSANLEVANDALMNINGNINIIGSNINIGNSFFINVNGDVNISSALEKNIATNQEKELEIGELKITKDLLHLSLSLGLNGFGSESQRSSRVVLLKPSNINVKGSMIADVNSGSDAFSGNFNVIASNLAIGNDATIKTANDFNIKSDKELSNYINQKSTLFIETGSKIGNSYADTAFAWKAVYDSEKKLIKATQRLKKIQELKKQGKASDKALQFAIAQLVLAEAKVASTTIIAANTTNNSVNSCATSFCTGFYGSFYLNSKKETVENNLLNAISRDSQFFVNNNINIIANNNINISGSNILSGNGNIDIAGLNVNITSSANNIDNQLQRKTIKQDNYFSPNGIQTGLEIIKEEYQYNKVFYNNSRIASIKGSVSIKSNDDLNIIGANIFANDINFNIGRNLNIKSMQSEEFSLANGYNFGLGAGDNISYNSNSYLGEFYKIWTDDITTIIANNKINISAKGDFKLTGAKIGSNDTNINVSGVFTKENINDYLYLEYFGLDFAGNLNLTNHNIPNQSSSGFTEMNFLLNNNYYQRTVFAIIDNNSKLISDIKSKVIVDFEGGLLIDHRLINNHLSIVKDLQFASDFWFGTNFVVKKKTETGNASIDTIPFTPVWVSRMVDENNNEIKNQQLINHPAPNLWTGNPFNSNEKSSVGRADDACKNSYICRIAISDYAIHLKAFYYGVPGFKSFSQFHDSATTNSNGSEKSGFYKFFSIFPYMAINYYGAIGTVLDYQSR